MNNPLKNLKKIPKSRSLRGFAGNRKGGRFHCGTDLMARYGEKVYSIEERIFKK